MATCIKIDRKSVVYMYVGGGAVDHDQSKLLGGLVVVCESWKWAAVIYTAARIAGLASNNYFGNIDQELVISADDDDTDNNATALQPRCDFPKMCEEMWTRLRTTRHFFDEEISDIPFDDNTYCDRSQQSHLMGLQLAEWRRRYAAAVEEFIAAE